jgi:apolipoprotein N-acyltransferase
VRIAAVQGNIPQIRRFSKAQLVEATAVYDELTLDIVAREKPDLVVWPETALPATLRGRMRDYMAEIFEQTETPLLAGTIDRRQPYDPAEGEVFDYNSALLYDAAGNVVNWYDKMHLVPFGEYVPFDRYLPFLVEWIGMGRNLTPGTEYTVMPFGDGARFGINICYEDVFPEISRNSVLRGANVLIVITNDAWFGTTSASRQHLAHSVLRAVETCRPLLRNGNNTDTCLILPDGRVEALLYGSDTRFIRAARVYDVPVWEQLPLTFYTRHGDWFALTAGAATILLVLWCLFRFLFRRQRLSEMVQRPE